MNAPAQDSLSGAGTAVGQGGSKRVNGNENLKKIVSNNDCFCLARMLTSKIIIDKL